MSMHPQAIPPVPEETAEVARAAFPKGNIYIQMRDVFGSIYTDDQFIELYPLDGQPAISPWRLALITVMQYVEGLSDRQAAEAVRDRIAWKYALSLELTDPGFDYSVLSEFRTRLVKHQAGGQLLNTLLEVMQSHKLLRQRGQQRTDSTHLLAAVRALNRLENVGETLRHALNSLAVTVPDWVRQHVPSDWYERYSKRMEHYRLPKGKQERAALAQTIGADGYHLMECLAHSESMSWLTHLPAVETLRRVWVQQYWLNNDQVCQRSVEDMPPVGDWIRSPYDTQARYSTKRSSEWVGYRVHMTETCDEDAPRLITHVTTTAASIPDAQTLGVIQSDLQTQCLLPAQQIVDEGYVDAHTLVASQANYQIDLVGPAPQDTSWQAQNEDRLDITHFQIDWQHQQVTCPQGHVSTNWCETTDANGKVIHRIRFRPTLCRDCQQRTQCTRSQNGRHLTIRPQAQHEALQAARQRQKTESFKTLYRRRAGIEGTISEAVRDQGLRRARYIGLDKTQLQATATATAINLTRALYWLDDLPLASTRKSAFAALAA